MWIGRSVFEMQPKKGYPFLSYFHWAFFVSLNSVAKELCCSFEMIFRILSMQIRRGSFLCCYVRLPLHLLLCGCFRTLALFAINECFYRHLELCV